MFYVTFVLLLITFIGCFGIKSDSISMNIQLDDTTICQLNN